MSNNPAYYLEQYDAEADVDKFPLVRPVDIRKSG